MNYYEYTSERKRILLSTFVTISESTQLNPSWKVKTRLQHILNYTTKRPQMVLRITINVEIVFPQNVNIDDCTLCCLLLEALEKFENQREGIICFDLLLRGAWQDFDNLQLDSTKCLPV